MTRRPRAQRLAEYIIRSGCRRLPAGPREERSREWSAEVAAILGDPGVRRTLVRSLRALRYAAGAHRCVRYLRARGRPVTGGPDRPATGARPDPAHRAVALLGRLAEGHWEAARRDFAGNLHRADPGGLAGGWMITAARAGRLEQMGEPSVRQDGAETIVAVPLRFDTARGTGRVRFDRDGQVAGLLVQCRRRRLVSGGRWGWRVGRLEGDPEGRRTDDPI